MMEGGEPKNGRTEQLLESVQQSNSNVSLWKSFVRGKLVGKVECSKKKSRGIESFVERVSNW